MGEVMKAHKESTNSGHQLHAAPSPSYLHSGAYHFSDESEDTIQPLDAGSQAWGDYLEEMEGYEI